MAGLRFRMVPIAGGPTPFYIDDNTSYSGLAATAAAAAANGFIAVVPVKDPTIVTLLNVSQIQSIAQLP